MRKARFQGAPRQRWYRRTPLLLAVTAVLSTPWLAAAQQPVQQNSQQQNSQQPNNNRESASPDSSQQNALRRPVRQSIDMVSENLSHVAAGANQILEVLNKDAGLMVELKRLIAQDAGSIGQMLEETDLTDSAISERLRTDLRARVIATRLLQRYGYLLPKVNPDSDLADEQKFIQQQRAQAIVRASERSQDQRQSAPAYRTCDPRLQSDCPLEESPDQRGLMRIEDRLPPALPNEQWPPQDEILPGPAQQENRQPSRELRADTSAYPDGGESVLASAPMNGSGGLSSMPRGMAGNSSEAQLGQMAPMISPSEIASPSISANGGTSDLRAPRPRPNDAYARYPGRGFADMAPVDVEPVKMVHRPNPYADAPSLYDLYVQAVAPAQRTERFGLDVFRRTAATSDTLPMDLPVGPDYVVGPGDGLSIELWGGLSQRLFRTVDREGRVILPEAGPILVSGKSLGEVQESVQRVLRTQFRDVSADVSLLRLRTVRVYVVGEVSSPGAYDVSSLSTPLNALFAAGGVTARGSLRRLEHFRGNQMIEEVDAYDLLLHGVRGDARRLENGDSLRVPPLASSVKVDGMVRRPAVYELRAEKNLEEVLDLAGGILPAAALRHIEVQRLDAHEKRTMLSLELGENSDKDAVRIALEKFTVQDGDEIHIFPIAPYNTGAVYLEGHVLRPGRYSYKDGMKLTDLIPSFKELLPEPSVKYAEIIRIAQPDNRPVVEGFDLAEAFEHPESAPKLQPLDTVRIFGRYDLEASPEFTVLGEVRAPGRYRISGEERLRDAIYQAGGATPDGWLESAQLFRSMPDGTTKVFSISLRDALAGEPLDNIAIQPRDRILVHRQPEKVNPPSVYVRGDVARPGRYPLAANMHVSDLVRASGGLLRSANTTSGDLTHYSETVAGPSGKHPNEEIPLNLGAALSGRGEDPALLDGDVLTVPQQSGWKDKGASVTLRGEVAKPGVYGIEPGERMSSLLRRAGGLLPTAYPQASVFERVEVHDMQEKTRQDLIQRLEQESTVVKTSVSTTGSEEAALQQAAMAQRQRVLEALKKAPVSGRLVVRVRAGQKDFVGSTDDIELRAGDTMTVPKQPGFVLIVGQVYNSNAITFTPGKNAEWYLSRAGGATTLANKKAIFIVRANGAVTSGGSGMWSGGVLSSTIGPGDTIVVPERAILGSNGWKNFTALAQIAEAGALSAAVIH